MWALDGVLGVDIRQLQYVSLTRGFGDHDTGRDENHWLQYASLGRVLLIILVVENHCSASRGL
jgi:hypothetical protein